MSTINYEDTLKHLLQTMQVTWKVFPTDIKFKLLSLSTSFFTLVYPLFKRLNFSSYYGGKKSYLQHYADSSNITMLGLLHKYTNEPEIPELLSTAILYCKPNSKYDFSPQIMQLGFDNMQVLSTPYAILQAFYYSQKYKLTIPTLMEVELFNNLLFPPGKEFSTVNIQNPSPNSSSTTLTKVFNLCLGSKEEEDVICKLKEYGEIQMRHILARSVKYMIEDKTTQQDKFKQIKRVREMMKEYNMEPNNKEWEEMMLTAAENGQLEFTCAIQEEGMNINCRDNNGCTPLHHYVISGCGTAHGIRRLVEHGADVKAKNNSNKTVFDLALGVLPKRNLETSEILDILIQLNIS